MKKKILTTVVAACLMCFGVVALSACSSSDSDDSSATQTSSTESDVVAPEDNTLIVGFDLSYPPYGYIADDGSYTGVDLDLAQEVCDRNGWTFQAEPIDWDTKDAALDQGTITCIWNGFTYEGREDDYAFSGLYMINEQVIVVKADSGITSFDDLAGKIVITQAGSAALDVLDGDMADLQATFDGGAVLTISDYNNAFMQLESGAVDAVACDLSIAAYQMSAKPDVYYQLDEQLSSEHYAVGFKNDEEGQALADIVTETLLEMDADGTVQAILEKYADQGIDYANWCLS